MTDIAMLRVLICDDELVARRRLARLLGALPEVAIAGECEDGEQVAARVQQGGVDVVLLDIQMPGLSGMDAAALLGDRGPAVVFCTAHPDYAVDAFALGACDYLLKPIEAGRLQRALGRVRSRIPVAAPLTPLLPRLAVPTRRGVVLLDPLSVTHATLEEELVTVFAVDPTRPEGAVPYITDFALADLEERLPPDRFVRVHRKALLNLAAVERLEPLDSGGYLARISIPGGGGPAVLVSRAAARELRRRLGLREG